MKLLWQLLIWRPVLTVFVTGILTVVLLISTAKKGHVVCKPTTEIACIDLINCVEYVASNCVFVEEK